MEMIWGEADACDIQIDDTVLDFTRCPRLQTANGAVGLVWASLSHRGEGLMAEDWARGLEALRGVWGGTGGRGLCGL